MATALSSLTLSFDTTRQQILLAHAESGLTADLGFPTFEIEGGPSGAFALEGSTAPQVLSSGAREQVWTFRSERFSALRLDLVARGFLHSPVLRFKFRLRAEQPLTMTRSGVEDTIEYVRARMPGMDSMALTEIQLSHFDPVAHSYLPYRQDLAADEIVAGQAFTGPVAIFHNGGASFLLAYEHGADHPNGFLGFTMEGPECTCVLRAVKGNMVPGRAIQPGQDWESVWFEAALFPGGVEAFLPVYRRFFLEEVCINPQSRQPYIFYNTWNYQERQKYFHGRPYLADMNAARMLAEIDVAHQLGVDVFVVDTGWYVKTGDWVPNHERFPEGLQELKRRLDEYGMKLGLWFNPTVAALTSRIFQAHPEYEMTREGKPSWRAPVWETEESTSMCLASGYEDDYIETMVRLNRELGVSYFKWDGVGQYGCDSPLHNHGTEANPASERAECYAYESGRAMIRIVEEVSRRCPDVIVDFDVTEGGRFFGLGFLSVGKYFLVNNGPYFQEFDIPRSVRMEPDTINVFFYPGPARPRICRQGVKFDPVIPSILFLTHYLPDGPLLSQANSMAALALGGNGFWGDLPALSVEEVAYLGEQVALYKQVAGAATRAYPRVRGFAGSSPEIHEKIDPESGSGLVAFFTVTPGTMVHLTQKLDPARVERVTGADRWSWQEGRLRIEVDLARNDARVVYILGKQGEG